MSGHRSLLRDRIRQTLADIETAGLTKNGTHPRFAQGGGRIITLASTAGIRSGTGRAAYGASKGGVINLTKVLAVELAEDGVTVNALAPGAIETELVKKMHSPETRINYRRAVPMDRYGDPEEVAHAALYLASRGASYVTGHILAVDGGFLAAGVLNKREDMK